jgi:hypothetical protein
MNVFLWVLQILLAAVFAMAGSTKLLQPYDKLRANPQMAWVGDFSPGTVKTIRSLELLAALELILPAAGERRPITPQRHRSRKTSTIAQRRDQTANLEAGQAAPKDRSQ